MMRNTLGFIGLGVMGEPMCRNLLLKSGMPVIVFDVDPAPLSRLVVLGAQRADRACEVVTAADVIFLSLPSGEIVEQVALAEGGLLANIAPGKIVVDLSTSPVDLTRKLATHFAQKGAVFVDAPVARTRSAAEAGTLSVTVGASAEQFEALRPWLATFASDITLCGDVGCGQVVKILNNMVLFQTVLALSEAKAIGERAGVDPAALFNALSKGSADSFALRNHGMKAMVPSDFPEKAFPVTYARKDLNYALSLASDTHVNAQGAKTVADAFERAIASGWGDQYWPVISRLLYS